MPSLAITWAKRLKRVFDIDIGTFEKCGGETSSTQPFIDAVDPDYVVVQSGRKCYSGTHIPDMSTLLRYCTHNADVKIYRTDEGDAGLATRQAVNGDDVVLRTNGHVVEVLNGVQAVCSGLAGQTGDQSC